MVSSTVTEREIAAGILESQDTDSHVFCCLRQINGINTFNKNARFFIDLVNQAVDEEAQYLMNSLKREVVVKMADHNIARYSVNWKGEKGLSADNEDHLAYGEEFCLVFYDKLIRMIDNAIAKVDSLQSNHLYAEVLQHLHMCQDVCKDFHGREGVVQEVLSKISDPTNHCPIVVYGHSGCGKTSLLSKLASIASSIWPADVDLSVALRFLGTSSDSSSLLPMLLSVCNQICFVYGVNLETIPTNDVTQLSLFFRHLLRVATAERPLFIILDSLDQLLENDQAHLLTWLPETLPPYVTMVVSILTEYEDMLQILINKLKNANAYNNFIPVDTLGCETSMALIHAKLKDSGRALSSQQWKIVQNALKQNSTPLYVKLIYNDLVNWKSYQNLSSLDLPVNVRKLISQLFSNTEKRHGRLLVFYAFSYITVSCNGISEGELEDLLSLEDIVLNDVYQYHVPPIRRIPPLLWTRIRSDLEGYLSEREVDGTNVISWYHRQFREVAVDRYLENSNFKTKIHSSMADYFLGRWAGVPKPFRYENHHIEFGLVKERESEADRMVQPQPLCFSDADNSGKRHFNLRKLSALPHHLLHASRFSEYSSHCIFNFAFLRAKIEALPLDSTVRNLLDIIQADNKSDNKEVRILLDTLRLSSSTIMKIPIMLASQIIGRLLPHYPSYPRIRDLIRQCDTEGTNESCLLPSFHCFQTPGGALEFSLDDHAFAPFGMSITRDGRFLISVSSKLIIWDIHTGDTFRVTEIPELKGLMLSLSLLRPDQFIVAHTNKNQVIVYQLSTGDYSVFENVIQNETIMGCSLLGNIIVAWSQKRLVFFAIDGTTIFRRRIKEDLDNYTLLDVVFPSTGVVGRRYQVILKCYDSDQMLAVGENDNADNTLVEESRLLYHDAIAFSKDLLTTFTCADMLSNDIHILSRIKNDNLQWTLNRMLPNKDEIFALTLSSDGTLLAGSLRKGYKIWMLTIGATLPVLLDLPYGVVNLPVHVPDSRLVAFTQGNRFLVTAARNGVYVFSSITGELMKTLVGHFGRILRLVALPQRDRVVTCSLDRKVNIWNIKDIMGEVFHIEKMEKPVKELLILTHINACMVRTRNEIGFWCLKTGSLLHTIKIGVSLRIIAMASKPDASLFVILDSQYVSCWRNDNYATNLEKAERVASAEVVDGYSMQICTPKAAQCLVIRRLIDHYNEYEVAVFNLPNLNVAFTFMVYNNGPLLAPAINSKKKIIVFALIASEHHHQLQVHYLVTGRLQWHKMIDVKAADHKAHTCTINRLLFIDNLPAHLLAVWSHGVQLIELRRRTTKFISDWNGMCIKSGYLGLNATIRGGLEVLKLHWHDAHLRKASTDKVLIPKQNKSIFEINNKVLFTPDERHVVYTHLGHHTVRVFRLEDGRCVGMLKCSAPINDIAVCGFQVIIGMEDAGITLATIADPKYPDSAVALENLPSRRLPNDSAKAIEKPSSRDNIGHRYRHGFRSVGKVVYLVSKYRMNKADSKACTLL